MSNLRPSLPLLAALAALAAPPAQAQSRIAIWEPTVIAAPGHYVVTRDISAAAAPGEGVVKIAATNVVLDLDGHTITATGNAAIYLAPPPSAVGDIEVRNGQVRGGYLGITHPEEGPTAPASRLRFERLHLSALSDVALLVHNAPVVKVVGCTVHGPNLLSGIQIRAGSLPRWTGVVTDNQVSGVGIHGIDLTGMAGGLVARNVVADFGVLGFTSSGIALDASEGVRVEGNVVHAVNGAATLTGISLRDDTYRTVVLDNVVSASLDRGIYVGGHGSLVSGNVVGGTTVQGIVVYGNANTLAHNAVESGIGHGVHVFGRYNLVDANTIEGHLGWGLLFDPASLDNAYRGNVLRNNPGGQVSGVATDAGGNIL